MIAELAHVFPGIGRCHHERAEIALLPWLSAYVLALGCGGRLLSAGEFLQIRENQDVQKAVLARDRQSRWLPRFDVEWLGSIDAENDIEGAEFEGVDPRIFRRRIGRGSWYQPESNRTGVVAGDPDTELTARPRLDKLAACRIVFELPIASH
jgi:hypothetical protein